MKELNNSGHKPVICSIFDSGYEQDRSANEPPLFSEP